MCTPYPHCRRRLAIAIATLIAAISVNAACGGSSTGLRTPSDTPKPSQTPGPTATPGVIDRSKLPVRLTIPGIPDTPVSPAATPSASPWRGSYLHVIDLTDGTARVLDAAPLPNDPATTLLSHDVPGDAQLSPDRQQLAYLSRRGVVFIDIATGSTHVQAYPVDDRSYAPGGRCGWGDFLAWAPDSRRVAVDSGDQMLILDLGTGAPRQVLTSTRLCDLAWSPDGNWIVFADGSRLGRVRPDGSDRLTDSTVLGPYGFTWSPDSSQFFFAAETSIFTQDSFVSGIDLRARALPVRDTSSLAKTPEPYGPRFYPFIDALSSTGTRAASVRADRDDDLNRYSFIGTRDLYASDPKILATEESFACHGDAGCNGGTEASVPLRWSPDDSYLAYSATTSQPPRSTFGGIHLVEVVSKKVTDAVEGPDSFTPNGGATVEVCFPVFTVGWISTTSLVTLVRCGQE